MVDGKATVLNAPIERTDNPALFNFLVYFKDRKNVSINPSICLGLPSYTAVGNTTDISLNGWLWHKQLKDMKSQSYVNNVINEMNEEMIEFMSERNSLSVDVRTFNKMIDKVDTYAESIVEYYEERTKMDFFYFNKMGEEAKIGSGGTLINVKEAEYTTKTNVLHEKRAALPNKYRYLSSTSHAFMSYMGLSPKFQYPAVKALDGILGAAKNLDLMTLVGIEKAMYNKALVGDLNGLQSNKTEELWLKDRCELTAMMATISKVKNQMDIDLSTSVNLRVQMKSDTMFPLNLKPLDNRGLISPIGGSLDWGVWWMNDANKPLSIEILDLNKKDTKIIVDDMKYEDGLAEGQKEMKNEWFKATIGKLGELMVEVPDNNPRMGLLKLKEVGMLYIIAEYESNPDLTIFQSVFDANDSTGYIPLKLRLLIGDLPLCKGRYLPLGSQPDIIKVDGEEVKINKRENNDRLYYLTYDGEDMETVNDYRWKLFTVLRTFKRFGDFNSDGRRYLRFMKILLYLCGIDDDFIPGHSIYKPLSRARLTEKNKKIIRKTIRINNVWIGQNDDRIDYVSLVNMFDFGMSYNTDPEIPFVLDRQELDVQIKVNRLKEYFGVSVFLNDADRLEIFSLLGASYSGKEGCEKYISELKEERGFASDIQVVELEEK